MLNDHRDLRRKAFLLLMVLNGLLFVATLILVFSESDAAPPLLGSVSQREALESFGTPTRIEYLAELHIKPDNRVHVIDQVTVSASGAPSSVLPFERVISLQSPTLEAGGLLQVGVDRLSKVTEEGALVPLLWKAREPAPGLLAVYSEDSEAVLREGAQTFITEYTIHNTVVSSYGQRLFAWELLGHPQDFPVDRLTILINFPVAKMPRGLKVESIISESQDLGAVYAALDGGKGPSLDVSLADPQLDGMSYFARMWNRDPVPSGARVYVRASWVDEPGSANP